MLPSILCGQEEDIPLLRPEERQAVDRQAEEFNQALAPALADAAKSTVRLWAGSRRLAYGTVVGDGTKILTKWSEIARAPGKLRAEAAGTDLRTVSIAGVYQGEDLAVLKVEGKPLTPVRWSKATPKLGGFLAAPQPDGRPAGFGVVSVLERNLRDTDQAFIGVGGVPGFEGPGVKVAEVTPESGAANAGIRVGDVILKVGDRNVSGVLELRNALNGVAPGGKVRLLVDAGGAKKDVEVTLGNRPAMPQFSGSRLQQMERMGGPISAVRSSFTRVVQTDLRLQPNQVGGPVVNLQGEVVGITMARADRTRSFVMPGGAVDDLLKKDAIDPTLAMKEQREEEEGAMQVRGNRPQGRAMPGSEERMRRHLGDMQRLMDYMREEMDALEGGR